MNGLIWHRLDSGIPYKPAEMSARGLDPRPKAVQTMEWMYDRMWGGIVTVYHVEPHGEEQIVPALRWREGLLAADGRPTLDDVGEFDKLLGQSARCLLTAEGIRHDGERFHDRTITTDLLIRLLRDAPKRGQRKGLSSGKVFVLVTWDPGDASFVHVWDWKTRKNVKTPELATRIFEGPVLARREKDPRIRPPEKSRFPYRCRAARRSRGVRQEPSRAASTAAVPPSPKERPRTLQAAADRWRVRHPRQGAGIRD